MSGMSLPSAFSQMTGMRSGYFCLIRSDSAFLFSRMFSSLNFERIQTNFQQRAEKLDSELQISLERIRHRYYHCLLEDYSNEQGLFQWNDVKKQELFFSLLFNVGKELAAFEVNWALYKHHQYLQSLCREVSLQLRASLVNILQRANSHGAKELLDNFPFLSIAE